MSDPSEPVPAPDGPGWAAHLLRSSARITDTLWIGGLHAELPACVALVVTLESTTPDADGVSEVRYHFRDTRWEPVPRDVVQGAVDAVLGADGPALVRCKHGLNRSALVAGLALRAGGMSGERARRQIRSRRPGALRNQYFADLVDTWPRDAMTGSRPQDRN